MERQITCINCPVGCRLQVTIENGQVINDSVGGYVGGQIHG